MFGVRGFRVSPGHFAERFALIVIIALGESIVAIGTGIQGSSTRALSAAALLGLVLACALWWAYFDVVALVSERHFREARGERLVRIARDSYSYLHLPMIAGIILVALGVKKAIGHVDDPLETVPAVALFGGIALYYAGHLGFRLRNVRTLNRPRLVAAVACLCLIPLSDRDRRDLGARAGRGGHLGRDRLRDDPLRRGTQQSARRTSLGGGCAARRDVGLVLAEALGVQVRGERQERVDQRGIQVGAAQARELRDHVAERPGVLVGTR